MSLFFFKLKLEELSVFLILSFRFVWGLNNLRLKETTISLKRILHLFHENITVVGGKLTTKELGRMPSTEGGCVWRREAVRCTAPRLLGAHSTAPGTLSPWGPPPPLLHPLTFIQGSLGLS